MPQTPYDCFKASLESYRRHVLDPSRPRLDPVQEALTRRMAQAIQAGLAAIDLDPGRWLPPGAPPPYWGEDAFVASALGDRLQFDDDPEIRWLLATYALLLADLSGICRHLERLCVRDLDDVPWLVAGTLLVEWSSGQPGTEALREALERVRAGSSDFASHLQQALTMSPGVMLELWQIADQILADPSARIPSTPLP